MDELTLGQFIFQPVAKNNFSTVFDCSISAVQCLLRVVVVVVVVVGEKFKIEA